MIVNTLKIHEKPYFFLINKARKLKRIIPYVEHSHG